jgi:hypothetical protein
MEKIFTVLWWIIRALILLGLFCLVAGTGICGYVYYEFSAQYHRPELADWMFMGVLGLLTLLFGWIFWVTMRALFRTRPSTDGP